MKQKHIWAGVIAILVILGVWWMLGRGNEAAAPETNDTVNNEQNEATDNVPEPGTDGTATNQLPTTNDAIAVSDQTSGSSITIDNYVLNKAGFIEIHEVTSEGAPGTIVGQSGYLVAGRGQDLEVNAKVVAGRDYIAMIHIDNGDKKFNPTQDLAAVSGGDTVMVTFKIVE